MNVITYDVMFVADHFIMVVPVETLKRYDNRDVEKDALDLLRQHYGEEFAKDIKKATIRVGIEELGITSAPVPGDPEDAGIER
jgi:hypothetical protein